MQYTEIPESCGHHLQTGYSHPIDKTVRVTAFETLPRISNLILDFIVSFG